MRTTVSIDDDLLRDLKQRAHREGTSLTRLVNQVLRRGMQASHGGRKAATPYREKTFDMGEPRVDTRKALSLAAAMEDDEVVEELARRK